MIGVRTNNRQAATADVSAAARRRVGKYVVRVKYGVRSTFAICLVVRYAVRRTLHFVLRTCPVLAMPATRG